MKLQELRSAEADFRDGGHPVIAVQPIGAVEQHSRHLPLGTDALIAELIAAQVEERMPDAVLLLPVVHVGASDHHLSMPGTISVGTEATADVIARRCLSLAASSGVRRFLVLNGHGGNQPAERVAIERIRAATPGVAAYALDYWSAMFDMLDERGVERPAAMGHADLIETSILLAQRSELVRMDLADADDYADELPSWLVVSEGIADRTQHGGVGDPRTASAEFGEMLLDAAVQGIVRLVERLLDRS